MKILMDGFRTAVALAFAVSMVGALPSAHAYTPIRTETKLAKPQTETAIRVKSARVVLADYGLIRRDFAETAVLSDAQVDQWLLSKTAYVSEAQARQTLANTPMALGPEKIEVLRPATYGRALVYRAGNGGLIDGKGAGASGRKIDSWGNIRDIAPGSHSDGLATLGEATREFLYEKLVRTVMVHAGTGIETLEHYAVIDWGFDVVHEDGSTSPAGMVLRQAHERSPLSGSGLPPKTLRGIETTLRTYGLTSTGLRKADRVGVDLVNIQGTADGALLDFGAYIADERFTRPTENLFTLGRDYDIFAPHEIQFIQPLAGFRVPLEEWGYGVSGIRDPKLDNPWIWSHELARDFRIGKAGREAFRKHFDNLVGRYQNKLLFAGTEVRAGAVNLLIDSMKHIR